MRFILDNSVSARWLFEDGSASDLLYATSVLKFVADGNVLVPSIWGLEVVNVIARAEKKYGLTEARSTKFMHMLERMNIQVDPYTSIHALNDTLQLARRYNLSGYDAAYLELALREGLPLATLDNGLEKALKKAGAKRFIS